jgi:hypothetical protein
VDADEERDERDESLANVRSWIQRWRPVVLLTVPGAAANLRALPRGAATADDLLRVAGDLVAFIDTNPAAAEFRKEALDEIGSGIEDARKETREATEALPREAAARDALTEASVAANEVLVRGTEVVRAIFGRTSPEYKQFIGRAAKADDEEETSESEVGEG